MLIFGHVNSLIELDGQWLKSLCHRETKSALSATGKEEQRLLTEQSSVLAATHKFQVGLFALAYLRILPECGPVQP